MNTKPLPRHISKRNLEQDDVIEEEYRSIMRIAEIFVRTGAVNTKIETPLGDFLFFPNEIKEK